MGCKGLDKLYKPPRIPRANRYFLPGLTYHLTHRCHNRKFLLRFACDRNAYRLILWKTKPRTGLCVLAHCITSNHVHLLVHAELPARISDWMQQAEGEFAQWHNRRKGRSGAYWEDRYHSTLIQSSTHSEQCMLYIELNMVRAGVVAHPRDWPWCSYGEWMGTRQRRSLLDVDRALAHLGHHDLEVFRRHYEAQITDRLAQRRLARVPFWTEAVAVGDNAFVSGVESGIRWRRHFAREEPEAGTWALKEVALSGQQA